MGKNGFSREAITLQGRWSSEAYSTYLKEGRSLELGAQLRVADCLAKEAREALVEELGPELPDEDAV